MNWFYAKDNNREGPVEKETLGQLLEDNVITPETLVWQEGMNDWKPMNTVPSLAALLKGDTTPMPNKPTGDTYNPWSLKRSEEPEVSDKQQCPSCSDKVSPDLLIPYGDTSVCPSCKDTQVQQLREGATQSTKSSGPGGTGGQTGIFAILGQAKKALSGRWGDAIVFLILYGLITMGLSLVIVPINDYIDVSDILSPLCTGALSVGYCIFSLNIARFSPTDNGMLFSGFNIFGKAFFAYIIINFVVVFSFLFGGSLGGIVCYLVNPVDFSALDFSSLDPEYFDYETVDIEQFRVLIPRVLSVVVTGILISAYVAFKYAQVFFILADTPECGCFGAFGRSSQLMKGKKLKYFGLLFVLSIITFFAAICFIIPLLWALPLYQISLACFYNDLLEPAEEQG